MLRVATNKSTLEPIYNLMKGMKLFYTGPVINTEMLVVMLEKHGISAQQEVVGSASHPDDLSQEAEVYVPEADYDRAYQLFYAEREDEL